MDSQALVAGIRERFPEGLTGIIPIGGTRTTYVVGYNRHSDTPGRIDDYSPYISNLSELGINLIKTYFEFGGQNLILPLFSYQGLSQRGEDYIEAVVDPFLRVVTEQFEPFYRENNADPYFAGIDTLLHLPEDHIGYRFGAGFAAFQKQWHYQEGRRKLVWEVAPIPLFSIWRAQHVMGEAVAAQLEEAIESTTSLDDLANLLYSYYARALYGTDLPMPRFYLGTNRNGDLKLRSLLPLALYAGGPFRLYYTPYPTLFTSRETLQMILEDLTFGKSPSPQSIDYRREYSKTSAEADYERFISLRDFPQLDDRLAAPDDGQC